MIFVLKKVFPSNLGYGGDSLCNFFHPTSAASSEIVLCDFLISLVSNSLHIRISINAFKLSV